MHFGELALIALFGYRFRSPDRDRNTDVARIDLIQETVHKVAGEMRRELSGLRGRLEAARNAAAALAGNDLYDGTERDSGTAGALRAAEQRLVNAEARVRQLDRQLDDMRAIELFVEGIFREQRWSGDAQRPDRGRPSKAAA